jgi:hypothetical protein
MGMIGDKCESCAHWDFSLPKGYMLPRKFGMKKSPAWCMKILSIARFVSKSLFIIASKGYVHNF